MSKFYPACGVKLPHATMAEATGEFRAPKQGEWFLSGAIIEAYLARRDLTTEYHIAKLVEVKHVTVTIKLRDL